MEFKKRLLKSKKEILSAKELNEVFQEEKKKTPFIYSNQCVASLLCVLMIISTTFVTVGIALSLGILLQYKNRKYVFIVKALAVICIVVCLFHIYVYRHGYGWG